MGKKRIIYIQYVICVVFCLLVFFFVCLVFCTNMGRLACVSILVFVLPGIPQAGRDLSSQTKRTTVAVGSCLR